MNKIDAPNTSRTDHYVLSKSLSAHSEQGPGVGTAYIMGMILIFIVLIVGSIFAAIKFR